MSRSTLLLLLGISGRSGTNYLYDLLLLHPDIASGPVSEDYVLARSDPLISFVNGITRLWQENYGLDEDRAGQLLPMLAETLESFLRGQATAPYVLIKTPSPINAHHAPLIFPRSPIILLVRDGRSVCESSRLSWGTGIAEVAERWAKNGQMILDFITKHANTESPPVLVRYEDLVRDTEAQLRRLLTHLRLDPEAYDYSAAKQIPVRGSSVYRGGAEEVHWAPVPKTADFKPLERHRHWDREQLETFSFLAGGIARAFGYS